MTLSGYSPIFPRNVPSVVALATCDSITQKYIAMASIQTSKRYSLARALRARATASRLLSPDTGNLKITRTCTMKIHYFILQIARRRRRNYVFSFKRSMGEPLKIEEKCVLAAGICGQLGGPAGICGPRTTRHPLHTGAPPRSVPQHRLAQRFHMPYGCNTMSSSADAL